MNSFSFFPRYKLLFIIFLSFCLAGLKIKSLDQFTGNEEELQLYENTYSLIIGIDNYPSMEINQQLNYAVSDARAVSKSMQNNFMFNEINTLYNEQATKNNIQKAVRL